MERILGSLRAAPEHTSALRTPEFYARLRHAAWPGNVRELRNYLERCLVFEDALAISEGEARGDGSLEIDPSQPYADQRRRLMDDFERRYLRAPASSPEPVRRNAPGIYRMHKSGLLLGIKSQGPLRNTVMGSGHGVPVESLQVP